MKKFTMVAITLIATTVINAQSIGTLGGGSVDKLGVGFSWGAWLDFGGMGFHYVATGSTDKNLIPNASNFITGSSTVMNVATTSESYGIFFSPSKKQIYFGGGLQVVKEYGVERYKLDVIMKQRESIYGLLGLKTDFGASSSIFEGRLECVIGKVKSINLGLGINLAKR